MAPDAPTPGTETANTAAPRGAQSRRRSWVRAAAATALGLVLVAVLTVAGLWWWAGTDGSLATALRLAGRYQPLSAERVSGSLRQGGRIERLVWEQDGLRVDARDVTLAWQPWSLLHGTLKLDRVAAGTVQVDDQRPPSAPSPPPDSLRLPVRIALDDLKIGQVQYSRKATFSASGISARYQFSGLAHEVELLNAQVASGQYSGRAVLSANAPLTLDASLAGAVSTPMPGSKTSVPLSFTATGKGPVTDLAVQAQLKLDKAPAAGQLAPQASATARVMPWAVQPLPEARADFRDFDVAALWPEFGQTRLTGTASVQPADTTTAMAQAAWQLQLQVANALPGPWDQHRLPLERLQADGEWRSGTALIRNLKAQLGGGELVAKGQWNETPKGGAPATAPAWTVDATLRNVNPARLHGQLAAIPVNGTAAVRSLGAAMGFDAKVEASGNGATQSAAAAQRNPWGPLRLRDANATGSWNSENAGGTLTLTALRVRTDDAELAGQLEAQPSGKAGKGKLTLTAPGLEARVDGELRPASGKGELNLRGRDAAQALRWLQKLPGVPASLQSASASGNAELNASWQGGWQDPQLQAQLQVPSLDLRSGAPAIKVTGKKAAPATAAATASESASTSTSPFIALRAVQATLSGRLSQAQLSVQGRAEAGGRRFNLQMTADAGRSPASHNAPLAESAWQGVVRQLTASVEDPALGSGAWRIATRSPVSLSWAPTRTGGAFESGAGEAALTAPNTNTGAATIAWQPVRWRPGELVTAGRITGLPMAWIELLVGPQLAGAGLGGNLVLNGEWDAVLSDTVRLKASMARASGDIMVQGETAQGTNARIAAGVKEARITLANEGESLALALRWDSERAGTAEAQLRTRLSRAPAGQGVGGWSWPDDAPLSGQVRAQLPRIGVWSVLAPPGWRLRGSLGADVAVSGTRLQPQLTGDLQANDLAMRSVVDGFEFGNGRLRARLDGTRMRINEFALQGAGDKGTGGSLTAQGEAGWINGQAQVQLDAKLERLRASIRTDRQLTVSGSIQASLAGKQAEVNGKLVVDQARIILPDEGTPQLGDDVVVRTASGSAAGQKAPAQTSGATADKDARAVKLAVQLDLGRDFRVQGKGIDTRVQGTLALNGDSLREPRLTGTINTAGGQYRAYGQRLDVEQGILRFTGAIDNPSLDILAIRPNLTQRVGVQITGTALLPKVRLYAQPDLPDAEKLSWLVVGRASATGGAEAALLQQAALALLGSKGGGGMSGGLASSLGLDELSFRGASSSSDGSTTQGAAVTLGKRFSRNFYAAYERSISGALGTLYVFYDLSQRFTVRAQAGQQSAVDLIFTVPFD